MRHSLERVTPLPLNIGLSIHTRTRKKDLITILFELGVSVPYDRVMQVLNDVANGVCSRFEVDKVVCLPNLRHVLFTVGALDNLRLQPIINNITRFLSWY